MNPGQKKNTVKKGREYEQNAAQYFESKNYQIIERNWNAGHKEIDFIALKDKTVVFVEVKSARNLNFGHPAERVDKKKRDNLIMAAEQYIISKNLQGYDYRFDLVTFIEGKLEHFENAFQKED
ncbi:MAG: YraN family protein [Candidatus Zixiibacteriota bacterium]